MRKANRLIILLPILLVMFSCIKKGKNEVCKKSIQCNVDAARRIDKLSDICDSVTLIPLDLNSKALLGTIDKVQLDEENIYLLSNNKCFIYDFKGNFKTSIGQRGHAKFEFVCIDDISLASNKIILADAQARKIVVFSKRGEPLEEIKVDFFPEQIMAVNDTILSISCSGIRGKRLVLYDMLRGKVIRKYFEYEDRFALSISQSFVNSLQGVLYKQPYSNIYYSINSQGSIAKAYYVDFGKYQFCIEDLKKSFFLGNMVLQDTKGNARILNFLETKKFYCIEFQCSKLSSEGQFIILVDKRHGHKSILIDSETFKDDILHCNYRVLPDFSEMYENDFVGVIYPHLWEKSIIEANIYVVNKTYQKVSSILQKNRDVNPIICIYHMK